MILWPHRSDLSYSQINYHLMLNYVPKVGKIMFFWGTLLYFTNPYDLTLMSLSGVSKNVKRMSNTEYFRSGMWKMLDTVHWAIKVNIDAIVQFTTFRHQQLFNRNLKKFRTRSIQLDPANFRRSLLNNAWKSTETMTVLSFVKNVTF